MLEILKRYAMALIFLFLVVFLMLLATIGVMNFGDALVEDIGIEEMQPRGENIRKDIDR